MATLRIVLLTGPSSAGKSHLVDTLRADGQACLDNDLDVMQPLFDLFPGESERQLSRHIGEEPVWQHVRKQIDFDRLVRLHHRDWYLRNGCPSQFVAIGWMYSRRDHRDQVVRAFRKVLQCPPQITVVQFLPDARVFVDRYCERQDRVPGTLWQEISARGPAARKSHALKLLNSYHENDWQPPAEGTRVEVVRDEPGAQSLVHRVFQDSPE